MKGWYELSNAWTWHSWHAWDRALTRDKRGGRLLACYLLHGLPCTFSQSNIVVCAMGTRQITDMQKRESESESKRPVTFFFWQR